jgi:nucleoside-triphosphatase THEP1
MLKSKGKQRLIKSFSAKFKIGNYTINIDHMKELSFDASQNAITKYQK